MRTIVDVANDLLKVVTDQYDLVEGIIFDRVPFDGKRKELRNKFSNLLSELIVIKERESIRKLERTGPAMAEDILPIEYELEDIKKELQRMYVLVHKLQYPPNDDIRILTDSTYNIKGI